ncbi:hypothetical protein QT199_010555 [Xanthomonas phaseoli pv. phaseoli]|uniref:Uncharacterized protein n=1 Tax=Xanthomonas campestris pv. phaseoli TaxID=317013 RepID=A0AB38DW75_XANCH|nr:MULTISPECIES: hypothetical protein [Xanthomonas]MBO9734725.1 hypothetical protein [Xanthomonas phaseoli pv. phaseoli]MBO9744888.1 hypothetical protein [Xanthomonas phaseoli pv. phaseoli]MDM4800528.1 hypothetical protein [Xanthomonas phaseoli pv. phaseoli]MDM4804365.1 hypothetical protein [Xanthomonas phaseoli pv. phaseoli]MDM4808510.1 hypothetical protein [Xanthomonas phaseoli pv. phaseoli]
MTLQINACLFEYVMPSPRLRCEEIDASRVRCPHRSRDTPSTRPWGLDGGIHAANGPAIGEDTAPDSWRVVLMKAKEKGKALCRLLCRTMRTDHLDWSLPAHRRGTLGGMDAATELTRTYLQHARRWWAGKGPAAKREDLECAVHSPHQRVGWLFSTASH